MVAKRMKAEQPSSAPPGLSTPKEQPDGLRLLKIMRQARYTSGHHYREVDLGHP